MRKLLAAAGTSSGSVVIRQIGQTWSVPLTTPR
jgi:hypothetical protein